MKLSSLVLLSVLISPGCAFMPHPMVVSASTGTSRPNEKHVLHYVTNRNEVNGWNEKNRDSLSSLSVTELKRLLTQRGIDFRDCLEKRDLVERLQNAGGPTTDREASIPLTELTPQEQGVIGTFKRVSPSVAYIQTTQVVMSRTRGFQLRGMEVPTGSGSGFLWDSYGHVVTNYHVVSSGRSGANGSIPKTVSVKLAGMPEARVAEVVGIEPEKDLAVLKLRDTSNLPSPIDVGTSNDLLVGQSVLAIGKPFGLDDTLTTGIVSALGRDVNGIGGRPIHGCIQTDAAINPGNSGGPLLDSRGRLIGVNTAIFSPGGTAGNVGIGFAIPVDTVRRVVNQIIRYGKVVRPTIGILVIDDRTTAAIETQLGRKLDGVLVAQVTPKSPALLAGIEATQLQEDGTITLGDLVTHVDGLKVTQTEDLISAIEERQEGDVVELTIMRKADPLWRVTKKVTLTTRDRLNFNSNIGQTGSSNTRRATRPSAFDNFFQ